MFLFGKKKKEEAQNNEPAPVQDNSQTIEELSQKEEMLEKADSKERNKLLNELGASYMAIGEIDKSIHFYETSLSESKEMGKAYTDLMKLYNMKRRTATEAKNDEQMKFYMDKIDELMKLSKDVIRGRA